MSSGLDYAVYPEIFNPPDPRRPQERVPALAEQIKDRYRAVVDYVVSPAIGGIVPGYETARQLGCKAIFVERENGEFVLRRGFTIPEGARVVMVEDIVTTGLSSARMHRRIAPASGKLLGAASLPDRQVGWKAEYLAPPGWFVAAARYSGLPGPTVARRTWQGSPRHQARNRNITTVELSKTTICI